MSGLRTYSGITTKIRAIRSRMLKKEQFLEMAGFHSVVEVINYLKGTDAYKDMFMSIKPEDLHRGNIEKLLKMCYYKDFENLYLFANTEQRKYLLLFFKRYELSFLKGCLRNICRTNSEDRSNKEVISIFKKYSKLDAEALQAEVTIEGFVEKLKGTGYYLQLKHVIENEKHSLFDYEIALDYYYFTMLWKEQKKKYKGLDAKIMERSLGYKIDILNMQWIYRSKKYYMLSEAEVYAMLIPINYMLTKADIVELVESKNIEDLSVALRNTFYGKLYPEIVGENLEDIYIYLLDKVHEKDGMKYPYSVAIINSYLYKKEYEINKITTIMEAIRYSLDYEKIIHYARLKEGSTGR